MAFCQYCGKEISETDEFCKNCGKPTKQQAAGAEAPQTAAAGVGRYATLGERFLAVLIDLIILGVATAIIMIPFGVLAMFGSPLGLFFGGPTAVLFLLWIVYFTYFESKSGQTIGKRAMSIKVVHELNKPVDVGTAIVRNVLRIIDWVPFLFIVGFILIAVTEKKQRLGDLVAKTIVVKAQS